MGAAVQVFIEVLNYTESVCLEPIQLGERKMISIF